MKKLSIKMPQLGFASLSSGMKKFGHSLKTNRKTQIWTGVALIGLFLLGEFLGVYSVGIKQYVYKNIYKKDTTAQINIFPQVEQVVVTTDENGYEVLQLKVRVFNKKDETYCVAPGTDIEIGGRKAISWTYASYQPEGWDYSRVITMAPYAADGYLIDLSVRYEKGAFVPSDLWINSQNNLGCRGVVGYAPIVLPKETSEQPSNGGTTSEETPAFDDQEKQSLVDAVKAYISKSAVDTLKTPKSGITFTVPKKATVKYTEQKTLIGNDYGTPYEYESDDRSKCYAFESNGSISDKEIHCVYETVKYTMWSANRLYKLEDGFDVYINSYPQSVTNIAESDYDEEQVPVVVENVEITFRGTVYKAISFNGTIFFTFQENGKYYTIVRDSEYTLEATIGGDASREYDENIFKEILSSAK